MFNSVLVPLSLNENQGRLEQMATALATFGKQEIILLHVVSSTHFGNRNRELQTRGEMFTAAGHSLRTMVRSGSIGSTVVAAAAGEESDLIAFPWRYKNWIQRTLTGSVTKDIVRLTDRPVLVYKSQLTASSREEDCSIMYATDFQDTDRFVVPYLQNRLPPCGRLLLLHTGSRAPDPTAEERRQRQVESKLERLAEECRQSGRPVETLSAVGHPRQAVLRHAHRQRVDILVIGRSDAEDTFFNIMGSTAEAVAYNARCSVLIFPRHFQLQESMEPPRD